MRPSSFAFSSPCCFSFICSSPCVSLIVSSYRLAVRLVSCDPLRHLVVLPVRPACRSAYRLVSLVVSVWRRSVLLFARSRLVCRGGLALRSRPVLFLIGIPFVPRLARRLVVASCRSVPLAVSSCLSRFCPVISFSLIRGRLGSVFMPVPVFAPFHPARRSFLFVNRARFLLTPPSWGGRCVWRAAWVCSLISSVPSHSYSLLGEDGDTGHRFTLLAARSLPLMSLSFSHRIGPLSLSYGLISSFTKAGKRRRRRRRRRRTIKTR